jgi:hypothetical protein
MIRACGEHPVLPRMKAEFLPFLEKASEFKHLSPDKKPLI